MHYRSVLLRGSMTPDSLQERHSFKSPRILSAKAEILHRCCSADRAARCRRLPQRLKSVAHPCKARKLPRDRSFKSPRILAAEAEILRRCCLADWRHVADALRKESNPRILARRGTASPHFLQESTSRGGKPLASLSTLPRQWKKKAGEKRYLCQHKVLILNGLFTAIRSRTLKYERPAEGAGLLRCSVPNLVSGLEGKGAAFATRDSGDAKCISQSLRAYEPSRPQGRQ